MRKSPACLGLLQMKYLLDTHIILWAALDVKRLSRKAKRSDGLVLISHDDTVIAYGESVMKV